MLFYLVGIVLARCLEMLVLHKTLLHCKVAEKALG